MVNPEIKTVGIIGYHRSEAYLRIHLMQTEICQTAQAVTIGYIVEITTHYHIVAAIMLYVAANQFGLSGTQAPGTDEFGQQTTFDFAGTAATGMAVGDSSVQFLVVARKADRLQMAVEHRNQPALHFNLKDGEICIISIRQRLLYMKSLYRELRHKSVRLAEEYIRITPVQLVDLTAGNAQILRS